MQYELFLHMPKIIIDFIGIYCRHRMRHKFVAVDWYYT